MESKSYFESVYTVNFESAKKYVQQNNLPDAKSSLQKAGTALFKLYEMSYGMDKEKYKAKMNTTRELLEMVNNKMNEANNVTLTNNVNNGAKPAQPKADAATLQSETE